MREELKKSLELVDQVKELVTNQYKEIQNLTFKNMLAQDRDKLCYSFHIKPFEESHKTFEEFYNSNVQLGRDFSVKALCKAVWDYQQKRIDNLQSKLEGK